MLRRFPVLLCAVLWVAAVMSLPAQEWVRFRGPNGTGLSTATTVPTSFTEKDYNWKCELPGQGHSSPVLWGKKIFLTSSDPSDATRIVLCVDATSGKIAWQKKYSSSLHTKHRFNTFASPTAAADAERAYFVWSSPEEYCCLALDHQGNEVWRRNLGPYVSQHSCGISPIVYEDLLILGNDQDEEGGGKSFLVALDRQSGQTRWQVDRKSDVVAYSTPFILEQQPGKPELIFNSKAHGISSLDPKTGKLNWEVDGLFDKRSVSSSLLAGGLLIGSCGSGGGGNYLVAIHPGGNTQPDAGQLAYRIDKSAPYVPTPIAVGDLLFLWSDQGVVSCVRASNGEIAYQKRVGGNFFGSPICVDGRLFCISTTGVVVVLAASDQYQLLAENDLGETSHSTPAVADGVLYLRTVSHLISVGGKK